jgi:hypothetical protein
MISQGFGKKIDKSALSPQTSKGEKKDNAETCRIKTK